LTPKNLKGTVALLGFKPFHPVISAAFQKLLRKEPQRNSGIISFLTISSCHLGSFSEIFCPKNLKGTVALFFFSHFILSSWQLFTKLLRKEP
jgi:hypothetical protein